MKPLVTVVTLSYRKFDFLYEAIDSVLCQTYERIEFIISDDGSPDFPLNEVESYVNAKKGNNIESFFIINRKSNVGTVKNINSAYRIAKGQFLLPLSADDQFFDANAVASIVEEFEKRELDCLITSVYRVTADGKPIGQFPSHKQLKRIRKLDSPRKQNIAFKTQKSFEMASGCNLYLRKSFFEKWGFFDERYYLWEDGPFFTQFTEKQLLPTAYDLVTIKYRDGGVSSSAGNPIMDRDMELYNSSDRLVGFGSMSLFNRRTVRYINKRQTVKTRIKLLILYLAFFDVMISKIKYKICNR